MAFNLGFQTKYILNPWCMLFHLVKVPLKVFSTLFKIHSACCEQYVQSCYFGELSNITIRESIKPKKLYCKELLYLHWIICCLIMFRKFFRILNHEIDIIALVTTIYKFSFEMFPIYYVLIYVKNISIRIFSSCHLFGTPEKK